MKLWSLFQSSIQSGKMCEPDWYSKGLECPYGKPTGPPMGTYTWPKEEDLSWMHYLAMLYSLMPFFLAVGFPVLFLFTRGIREILAIIFFWTHKAVMQVMKHMVAQRRPEGSCLHSCGMPSGHSLDAACFLAWFALEVALAQRFSLGQKVLYIGAAGVLLGPVAWSRVFFNDHSLAQVSVGSAVGVGCGLVWYLLLQLRCTTWLLKAVVANTFLVPNYPVDPPEEEAPWPQRKPAGAMK